MNSQATQLHDKVQKLIEQYSIDKKRLAELEAQIKERNDNSQELAEQLKDLNNQIQVLTQDKARLTAENNDLKQKNSDLEKSVGSFEVFAQELNKKIDIIIPQIEKL